VTARVPSRRFGFALIFGVLLSAACSEDGGSGDPSGAAGQGGSAGQAATGAGRGGGTAGAAAGAGAGTGGEDGFAQVGVCGQRGDATVNASAFMGFEEFYLIAEEGFGDEICVVRFEVTRVGEAPAGCDDPAADVDCLWTHRVEFSDPSVVTDVDGVCADSQLGLDEPAIAAIDGSQAAYGYVSEFAGHNSVLMKYDDEAGMWDAYGNGRWDAAAERFRFDRRDGLCNY
jgi:hypothetical protein